jgi:iron complex outermembrane receptor protein
VSRSRAVRWPAIGCALALLAVLRPAPASSQTPCLTREQLATGSTWDAPLTRLISLHAAQTSLRDALDRIAAAGHVRFTYSAEALPLEHRICISLDSVPMGDVLVQLLRGSTVGPIVTSQDHVVLAPGHAPPAPAAPTPEQPPVYVMDRVVVTGSATGEAQRKLAVALDILEGRQLVQQSVSSLAEAFNATVPGLWLWDQSPSSLVARYGSIRGASSFGASYPKVYIDGIEVANPLLLTRLAPEAIERVEVIRGPQGAALYGADAISGVTNIVTRHDVVDAGAPRARLSSGFSFSSSDFVAGTMLAQEHALALSAGSTTRSLGLHLDAGSTGEFIPGAYSRHLSANASARIVGSRSIITGTFRLYGEHAGTPASPLLVGTAPARPANLSGLPADSGSDRQSMVQYTIGMSARFMKDDQWTHSVVFGIDGYSLDGVPDDRTLVPTSADQALQSARGGAARGTLRVNTVGHFDIGPHVSSTVTLAAEHSVLRQRSAWDESVVLTGQQPGIRPGPRMASTLDELTAKVEEAQDRIRWRGNSGFTAQTATTLFDHFFLTGGLRIERDQRFDARSPVATLPMLGGAWVREDGAVTLKVRAAYGKGIRWPETPVRQTLWDDWHETEAQAALGPERQSGIEGGFDLMFGRALTLQVTRFDQAASGLIQRVCTGADSLSAGSGWAYQALYEFQNVGEISNRGWEIRTSMQRGPLALSGALSLVDSRVRRLADGYTGDLRPGDRMLEVPAQTLSFNAGWTRADWSLSLGARRAADWINYDRVALARALSGNSQPPQLVGSQLRAYWREYDGVTHLRATATRNLGRGLALTLLADNLLDRQSGEPDNITVLPGRTLSIGLRARF